MFSFSSIFPIGTVISPGRELAAETSIFSSPTLVLRTKLTSKYSQGLRP